jgi:hypothetical protein
MYESVDRACHQMDGGAGRHGPFETHRNNFSLVEQLDFQPGDV